MAPRQLVGAGADGGDLLMKLFLHRTELKRAGMSIATSRRFENPAPSHHAVAADDHRVR